MKQSFYIQPCSFSHTKLSSYNQSDIQNLMVHNNTLSFISSESSYVTLSYVNIINNRDHYKAWTAGKVKKNHLYHLHVNDLNIKYQIEMKISNSDGKVFTKYAKIAILTYGDKNPYSHPRALDRFSRYYAYGTNPVPNPPTSSNFHFDSGNTIIITDEKMILLQQKTNEKLYYFFTKH